MTDAQRYLSLVTRVGGPATKHGSELGIAREILAELEVPRGQIEAIAAGAQVGIGRLLWCSCGGLEPYVATQKGLAV
jgi:hypothetical protein